ncbi:hypothetical protein [Sulfurospirillum multivorans]|uniref:Uncharacterized protein n=2 Tax=Sulfurospirillum multivorans TaxID=66821 RepID=A0AA86E248_SULMK|nr:hypothetical protein [Sulfurospirillum multivorans]AHJ12432.1 hypothetical protein SMUL_1167 [Sulfurospirillum multivorans DSM 12446]QEH05929.1 hypothetical protein SMN_1156 [Sulfurospirillum multivorans]
MRKILDGVLVVCIKGASKAKEIATKAKDHTLALVGFGSATFGAVQSKAAIIVDPATGVMSGSMEMGPFFGGVTIAAAAIAVMLSVFLGIKALKKVA